LRTKGNRKRIGLITALGLFSQWSGNGLISYYLKYVMDSVGITKASTQLGINAGIKSEALVMNFLLAFFIDRLGRRPIYMVSTVGTFLVFNAWTIVSARYDIAPNNALGYIFVVLTVLYGFFYDIK
jgi:MFS family permease